MKIRSDLYHSAKMTVTPLIDVPVYVVGWNTMGWNDDWFEPEIFPPERAEDPIDDHPEDWDVDRRVDALHQIWE